MTPKEETQTCSNCKKVFPTQVLSKCQICDKLVCHETCMKSNLNQEITFCPSDFERVKPMLMHYQLSFTTFAKTIVNTFNTVIGNNCPNMPKVNSLEDFLRLGNSNEDVNIIGELEIATFYLTKVNSDEIRVNSETLDGFAIQENDDTVTFHDLSE